MAGEDSSFFEHAGIDYRSILRAAWVNLRAGGEIKQGASTITQQMVKGLLLSPERKFRRKIREMILAQRIEKRFSKQEILYLYLNQIYFGHGAYGIREAARTYFDKDTLELSVSESALLAGLPKAPSRYSPFQSPEEAEERRRYVLSRMHTEGFLDAAGYSSRDRRIARPGRAHGDPERPCSRLLHRGSAPRPLRSIRRRTGPGGRADDRNDPRRGPAARGHAGRADRVDRPRSPTGLSGPDSPSRAVRHSRRDRSTRGSKQTRTRDPGSRCAAGFDLDPAAPIDEAFSELPGEAVSGLPRPSGRLG